MQVAHDAMILVANETLDDPPSPRCPHRFGLSRETRYPLYSSPCSTEYSSPSKIQDKHALPTPMSDLSSESPELRSTDASAANANELEYLHEMIRKQAEFAVTPNSFAKVQGHPLQVRRVLVSWMQQNGETMGMSPSTVALAVSYMDRFFARQPVSTTTARVVAVIALSLAAKFNEVRNIPFSALAKAVDTTNATLRRIEEAVLEVLQFRLNSITPHEICAILHSWFGEWVQGRLSLLDELLDLTQLDTSFLGYVPSTIAAAAYCSMMEIEPWQDGDDVDMRCGVGEAQEELVRLLCGGSLEPGDGQQGYAHVMQCKDDLLATYFLYNSSESSEPC